MATTATGARTRCLLTLYIATDLFVLAAMVHDLLLRGRPHPASWWGALTILVFQPMRLVIAETNAWRSFAALLIG